MMNQGRVTSITFVSALARMSVRKGPSFQRASRPNRRQLVTLVIIFLLCQNSFSTVAPIELLFDRIDNENSDVEIAKHHLTYHEESLRASHSFLFPNLNVNASTSKGKQVESPSSSTSSSTSTEAPSPSGTDTSTASRSSPVANTSDGWNVQLSSSYQVFAHYSIDQSIKNSRLQVQSAGYELSKQRFGKRSQLIQAILEWQWLKGLQPLLQQAKRTLKKVKGHADEKSAILYSAADRADLLQKDNEIQYNSIKVSEGIKLVESVLNDLLPSLTTSELEKLPKIAVQYELPPAEKLDDLYIAQSLARKSHENDVEIARGNYYVATWKRPWIPAVTLNASFSKFGDFKGGEPDDNWSVGLVFAFNIFDGFYTDARREQTHVGLMVSEARLRSATSKANIKLQAHTMKALVSQAEFKLKESIMKKKKIDLDQEQSKQSQGLGTELEVSYASLNYVKARFDALEALKNYQSASLEIAVDINEWNKVNIYDVTY